MLAASPAANDRAAGNDRNWVNDALRRIDADFNRSADTHLFRLELPAFPGLTLYFKDESSHPTGSLKHRLARSLFLYGLCNGWIGPKTTIVEASSGSTAVSEAYFARLLGLPFVAVMPKTTSAEKIAQIEFYGGRCHLVEQASHVYAEAERLARDCGGHYMDQFTYSERATDWRGNNNIAEAVFEQMAHEEFPEPTWVVVGAGTGGTSATIGRYIRYHRMKTQLCVVDVENSVFHDFWHSRDPSMVHPKSSRIEGIGRPRVEASFMPDVVDRMIRVPDAASLAGMRLLSTLLGRRVGGSTGTNFIGVLTLLCELKLAGQQGSVVTLLCDSGDRYACSYYDDAWLTKQGIDIGPDLARLTGIVNDGCWQG